MVPMTGNGRGTQRVPDHLKQVPDDRTVREQIRRRAIELADGFDKSRPLVRHEMELHAQRLLTGLALPQAYLGWTMVALASAFWREQVAAVPHHRRLLLLPRCLRNEEACPAECDELGLLCRDCGACSLTELRSEARRKGYHVMIAEGSPTVMKIILGGQVDALLGVACLDVLERTLDKILLAGIPCMAVPLLTNGCRNTSADADWIRKMFDTPHRPAAVQTRTYLHLMRCAAQMFEPAEFKRLVPPARGARGTRAAGYARVGGLAETDGEGIEALDPVACTEAIAYDFLTTGGKHSRPFITLAVYDALSGGRSTLADGARRVADLPDAIKRIALAIEVFHKASLVHDDVEDDDCLRYGRPTLHRKYGPAAAINVGDYLIGLGYRLVAGQRDELGAQVVADVLAQFAQAHTRLCEGQGAELVWRDARNKRLAPLDALKIYALKTAPAFEAALLAGVRLAGPADPYRQSAARFARHLGVAYQILNDLDDWQGGPVALASGTGVTPVAHGSRGSDLLGGRPTVLWALALQGLDEQGRHELESLVSRFSRDQVGQSAFSIQHSAFSIQQISRAAELYERAGAFERAAALVSRHHQRAVATAEQLQLEPLRYLLHFLADAILDRRPLAISEEV